MLDKLEEEIQLAIDDVRFGLEKVSPSVFSPLYDIPKKRRLLNVASKSEKAEISTLTVLIDSRGFRVVGNEKELFIDFESNTPIISSSQVKIEKNNMCSVYYESFTALLLDQFPSFQHAFHSSLCDKLLQLKEEEPE